MHAVIRNLLSIAGAAFGGACVTAAVAATQPASPQLAMIEPGQWALKSRSNPAENRSVCVSDATSLLQLRHSGATCTRYVVASAKTSLTVQYVCQGGGTGRTTVRVETPRLIQIDSQGIADDEPFAMAFEGRRVGGCAPGGNPVHR